MPRTRIARARSRRQRSFPVLLEALESRLVPGTVLSVAGELLASLAWGRLGGHEPAGSAQPVPPPHLNQLHSGGDTHATVGPHTALLPGRRDGGQVADQGPASSWRANAVADASAAWGPSWLSDPLAADLFPGGTVAHAFRPFADFGLPELRPWGEQEPLRAAPLRADALEQPAFVTPFTDSLPWQDPVFQHFLATWVLPFAAPPAEQDAGGGVRSTCTDGQPVVPVCDEECTEGLDDPLDTPIGLKDKGDLFRHLGKPKVRYGDGTFHLPNVFVRSTAFGNGWGMNWQWSNFRLSCTELPGPTGSATTVPHLPFLRQRAGSPSYVVAVSSSLNQRWFQEPSLTALFFVKDTLTHDAINHYYTLIDPAGNRFVFHDFDGSWHANRQGQLLGFTAVSGVTLNVVDWTSDWRIEEVQRSAGGLTESIQYTYVTTVPNTGLLASALLRRQVTGGGWVKVEQVDFDYYVDGDSFGNTADLETATLKRFKDLGGGSFEEIPYDTAYYRYYTSDGPDGYDHGLKYVFQPASFARLQAAVSNPFTAPDGTGPGGVGPYADYYLTYDTNQKVKDIVVQAAGCSCGTGGGLGTFHYEYATSSFGNGYNNWKYKTTETLPDNTRNIVYANYAGQVMLKVFKEGSNYWPHFYQYDDTSAYPVTGRLIRHAMPSAIDLSLGLTTLEGYANLLRINPSGNYNYLHDSSGLIERTDYHYAADDDRNGYFMQASLLRGELGTPVLQRTVNYTTNTAGGVTVVVPSSDKVYRDGTTATTLETVIAYPEWYAGTNQVKRRTVTPPTVVAAQNGPDAATPRDEVYDVYGRLIWERDADGFLHYTAYDLGTGAVTQRITDVDTNLLSNAAIEKSVSPLTRSGTTATATTAGDHGYLIGDWVRITGASQLEYNGLFQITGVPTTNSFQYQVTGDPQTPATGTIIARWGTPSGGGLHLTTDYVVDTLGRTTKVTTPEHTALAPHVHYTVYNDAAHESRTYPGFYTVTDQGTTYGYTTGPIQVSREVREVYAGGPKPLPYQQSLTYEVVLKSTDVPATLNNGVPLGTETITVASLHSLGRQRTNAAGQVTEVHRFHSFLNMTQLTDAGTQDTNYYRSKYGYDSRGRRDRVETPTITITRTVFDGLDRPVSTWVGTNDTPTSGEWSPTNNTPPANMTQVRTFLYDSYTGASAVGDGNLTQVIDHPGATPLVDRKTEHFYDWRNRRVASKAGVDGGTGTDVQRPLTYLDYDNLGRVTARELYDADGITTPLPDTTPADGVPDRPAVANRRARTTAEYDNQDRVFRTRTYLVSQSDGVITADDDNNRLRTNTWYNKRGLPVKTAEPGGLVQKTQYDGAGRVTKAFATDGGGDTTWLHALDVAGDNVLTQNETQYDKNGNVIFTLNRGRFHDESGTGALCDPTGTGAPCSQQNPGPKARVYYTGSWFDKADRLTEQKNYGTCGGTVLTARPVTPPTCETPALVTSTGYKADDVQQVVLYGNPTGNFTLTFDGQPTANIPHTASASTVRLALEALTNLDVGDVFVTGPAGGPWNVRFAGARAEANQVEMTANGAGLSGTPPFGVYVATTAQGGDAGRAQKATDPRGFVTKKDYDPLGRTVRTVEAFTNFVPAAGDDRTTEYTYDGSNQLVTLTARKADGSGQTTLYGYTATKADGNEVESNELLVYVLHPDKLTGLPSTSTSDTEIYLYNALGQEKKARYDRNGTTHSYFYDVVGRRTTDAVTLAGGSTVDPDVQLLTTEYDTAGRPYRFTSFGFVAGPPPSYPIRNQVERAYNGLGQLTDEYQCHTGYVSSCTGGAPLVRYAYSQMSSAANHSRLTALTYPNSRVVNYDYTGTLNNAISRLSALVNEATTYEGYDYLGLSTVARRWHQQGAGGAIVGLTYLEQTGDPACTPALCDAGDKYRGLDRFGRVVDQRWLDQATPQSPTDRFGYGYDKNSNRLYRDNLHPDAAAATYDELYHSGGALGGYDALNQLTGFKRGTLNAAKDDIQGTPTRTQTWGLDEQGNWTTFSTNSVPQAREHNYQNQATRVGGNYLAFDNNGNTRTDENGRQYVYDAWDRLVEIKTPAPQSQRIARFTYDALGRRVCETAGGLAGENLCTVTGGTRRDFYYSAQWQVLEEHLNGAAKAQYVWSPGYVDALVLRDRNNDTNPDLEERRYVQQDANWNVTALANPSGGVSERYVYDPYGTPTVLQANWTNYPVGQESGAYDWLYLHQGGRYFRFDASAGTYHFRNRELFATLGRWLQVDPIGFEGGDSNLYRYVHNNPQSVTDSTGTTAESNALTQATQGVAGCYEIVFHCNVTIWITTSAKNGFLCRIALNRVLPIRIGPIVRSWVVSLDMCPVLGKTCRLERARWNLSSFDSVQTYTISETALALGSLFGNPRPFGAGAVVGCFIDVRIKGFCYSRIRTGDCC